MERRGFDVMLLTETKIKLEAYSHNRLGYEMTCLASWLSSTRGTKGGIGMVTRERPVGRGIDSTCYHGTNVVSCTIITRLT